MNKQLIKPLKEIFPNWEWDRRTYLWLWLNLRGVWDLDGPASEFETPQMVHRMIECIERKRLYNEMEGDRESSLLPDRKLAWIEKDGRQPNWLLHELRQTLQRKNNYREVVCPPRISPRENLIGLIDQLRCPLDEKDALLRDLKQAWNKHLVNDKFFSWFNLGNPKMKCGIAWNWYQEEHSRVARHTTQFKNLNDLLCFLDSSSFTLEEKRFHIDQIKKAAKRNQAQKNLRGKKQTNLALSNSIREQLSNLANRDRTTMVEVVEQLIQHAHRYGMPKAPEDFNNSNQDPITT